MVDSHAHIFLCERPEDEIIADAVAAGVGRILNIGLGGATNGQAIGCAERNLPVFASVGCHPTEANNFSQAEQGEIAQQAGHPEVLAIGETGLDYYRDSVSIADQRYAFEAQIEIAGDQQLPIVIHARDRDEETRAIDTIFELLDERINGTPVVLHCFSAPTHTSRAAERGWYCSFAGHTTYPKSEALREAASELPSELLLVETDSPYLAPQEVRGRANEPAHVVETARVVAETRGISYAELERVVEDNARTLFGW